MTRGLVPTARSMGMRAKVANATGGERANPSHTPLIKVRRESMWSPAPWDCATSVSMPNSMPVAQIATG